MTNLDATAIDVCAGAGLFSHALELAGFDVVAAVDHDPVAVETHRRNVGPCDLGDLASWHPPQPVDLVAGGPPCQPHSEQGKKRGLACAEGRLYLHLLRVAREADARVVVMENVRGLTHARRGEAPAVARVLEDFAAAGFPATHRVLDAARHGDPQRRERVFVVGFRDPAATAAFRWPEPTHGPPGDLVVRPWRTVREALGLVGAHRRGGKHLPVSWWQGARRIDVDAPAFTIGTRDNEDWLCPVDGAARRLTFAECALLQSCPPGWTWPATSTDAHRLMGNGVPINLGRAVGGGSPGCARRQRTEGRMTRAARLPSPLARGACS